jgi:hypothetical protein
MASRFKVKFSPHFSSGRAWRLQVVDGAVTETGVPENSASIKALSLIPRAGLVQLPGVPGDTMRIYETWIEVAE